MKKSTIEAENIRLRNELSKVTKDNKSLSRKLETSKCKTVQLQ